MLNINRRLLFLMQLSISSLRLRSLLAIVSSTIEAASRMLIPLHLYFISSLRWCSNLARNTLVSLRNNRFPIGQPGIAWIRFVTYVWFLSIHNSMWLTHLLHNIFWCITLFLRKVSNLQLIIFNSFLIPSKFLIMTCIWLTCTMIDILQ